MEMSLSLTPSSNLPHEHSSQEHIPCQLEQNHHLPAVSPQSDYSNNSSDPIRRLWDHLLGIHQRHWPQANLDSLHQAYAVAQKCHSGQKRRSGDPYIIHPLAVAIILAELRMDTTTLVAALLHDTIEDTFYSREELTTQFGEEVAYLVDGVTKLDKVDLGSAAEAETIRKMIIAMARDPRVLVIKVADRLHNMRTIGFLSPEKQQRKAKETLEVIAPLAHRLGMATIKWELEDRAFAILDHKKYAEIARLVAQRTPSRETYLAKVQTEIIQTLSQSNINATVQGRPKHYWSIYQKMIVRGCDFDDIYDLVGLRILCEQVRDCYAAVGVVHSLWKPMAGRFKDYIAQPRYGIYRSLHTTVVGPEGKPLEIQIRTKEMHRTAEYGIAAHWRYKETQGNHTIHSPHTYAEIDDIAWMRQLLDWQREAADPDEFLDSLRYDLALREIFVFTPKGDVIRLPAGSTPVDFAYAVHTEVGHLCIGARVNGRLVPLERKLDNGEVVEIFTSKAANAGPSWDWQQFVVSQRAKTKIRQWFVKERRDESLESGKGEIAAELKRLELPLQRLINGEQMAVIARELHYLDIDRLYIAVGEGHLSAHHVVQKLLKKLGGIEQAKEELVERHILLDPLTPHRRYQHYRLNHDVGVQICGADNVETKLARCCTPVPGDAIVGFVTRGRGVSVHRTNCANAIHLQQQSQRFVDVQWAPSPSAVFLVAIQVEALDRHRLLTDVTRVLSDEKVNIISGSMSTSPDRVAISRFTFEMANPEYLGHLLNVIRNVDGVYDAYRIASAT